MLYKLFIGLVLPVKSIFILKYLKNLKYNNSFNKKYALVLLQFKNTSLSFLKNRPSVFLPFQMLLPLPLGKGFFYSATCFLKIIPILMPLGIQDSLPVRSIISTLR